MTRKRTKYQAVALADLGGRHGWLKGSTLYRVFPALTVNAGGFVTETQYVVVAVMRRIDDRAFKETTLFAAQPDGKPFGGVLDSSIELRHPRIVGTCDHALVFASAEGSPKIVPRSEWRGPDLAIDVWPEIEWRTWATPRGRTRPEPYVSRRSL